MRGAPLRASLPEVTFTCNRLDRTQQRDKPLSAADGHTTIYEMLGGKYRDNAVDAAYDSFETFPSYLQVSLGVARDLSDQPGYVTRVLDEPLEIDPQTALPDSFILIRPSPQRARLPSPASCRHTISAIGRGLSG
jgi:hypothetical protein